MVLVQKIESVRIDVKPNRGMVAIDEMKLRRLETFYVWSAIDIRVRELLAIRASWLRSIMDDLPLKQVLKTVLISP